SFGFETWINRAQIPQCPHHEAGGNNNNHRDGDLRHHEELSCSVILTALRTAMAGDLEVVDEIQPAAAQCRNRAEQQPSHYRQQNGESQDSRVDGDVCEAWYISGRCTL